MQEIIYNNDNLKDNELDETVTRVKAVIINDKDEILLGKCHNTYQFPGGHLHPEEDLTIGLICEVKEETGIELTNIQSPFALIKGYCRNYRSTEKNRLNLIYYYFFHKNYLPDKSKTNLDEYEKLGNYESVYIPLNHLEDTLNTNINLEPINPIMYEEMLKIVSLLKTNIN